jgi:hypothetical protein
MLTNKSFEIISDRARALASAPVVEKDSVVVCMVKVMPGSSPNLSVSKFNQDAYVFTGELRTVLAGRGCWNSHHVNPANAEDVHSAEALSDLIDVLTAEITKNIPAEVSLQN